MTFTQIDGNILHVQADVIAHVANCFNTMGSGVALAIKNEFPDAYAVDCKTTAGDPSKMGTISMSLVSSTTNPHIKAVANMYAHN